MNENVNDLFDSRPAEFRKGISLKLTKDLNEENVIQATITK